MRELLKRLNQRPIAYYPVYRQITGSTTAGILLSQLMFWFGKQDKFYKTDEEIREETLLTEWELKTAKSALKKVGFIKITREGVPAKTFYEIDWDKYELILNNIEEETSKQDGINSPNKLGGITPTSSEETSQPVRRNPPNKIGGNLRTIYKYTKTTTEITTENKEKEKIYKKEKNLETFKNLWNEYAQKYNLASVKALSKSRINKLKARMQDDKNFLENFKAALNEIENSEFLQGSNDRNWKINFDWLISNDTNYLKVVEGKYSDKDKYDFSQFGSPNERAIAGVSLNDFKDEFRLPFDEDAAKELLRNKDDPIEVELITKGDRDE